METPSRYNGGAQAGQPGQMRHPSDKHFIRIGRCESSSDGAWTFCSSRPKYLYKHKKVSEANKAPGAFGDI